MTVLLLPLGAFLRRTVLSYIRRERQSLMSSHQQSWWLTDRVTIGDGWETFYTGKGRFCRTIA
jgi:hypothetical protein